MNKLIEAIKNNNLIVVKEILKDRRDIKRAIKDNDIKSIEDYLSDEQLPITFNEILQMAEQFNKPEIVKIIKAKRNIDNF